MAYPRTLVFTAKAPPSSTASAQVLARLTSGVEEYFGYIHQAENLPKQVTKSTHFPVKNDFENLSQQPILWHFEQFGWYRAAVREGVKQTNNSKWDVILACHPSMAFALAAASVARKAGLPLVLYLMDLFADSRANPVEKFWARATERRLLTQASTVICLTEGVQNYYFCKYNINSVLISHCVTESEIAETIVNKPDLTVKSPVNVTYAGGVYQARLDSLVTVKQAIEKLNAQGYQAQLLILGRNDPDKLAAWGLEGPYVSISFIKDRNDFMRQLRQSDILLSTIAFKSAYPLQDQTCFPTKTFDYFLAGKPVLVVAPDNIEYVAHLKKNASALIVTALNSDVVAEYIYQLATNMSVRKQLVDSGLRNLGAHPQATMQASLNNVLVQSVKSSGA